MEERHRDKLEGKRLRVTVGECSQTGLKSENEDCMGVRFPDGDGLITKGAVAVVADGVSAASGGKVAAEMCVNGFLSDYFSTPDSWTIKTSAKRVLDGLNRWLYGQGHSEGLSDEKGYVSTFSSLVLCSRTGHLFNIGDTRIYRIRDREIEQLTRDHRSVISKGTEYLTRAMGLNLSLKVDYKEVSVEVGDCFMICTDGVHDWLSDEAILECAVGEDLVANADLAVERALAAGSDDNLTCVFVRVEELPEGGVEEVQRVLRDRPFPPLLAPGMVMDGLEVEEVLFESARSQLYRVKDQDDGSMMVMKTPSPNFKNDALYIERFVAEEWIGKRVDHKNLVKVVDREKRSTFLYYLMEEIDGESLSAWLKARDGQPSVLEVVGVVEQIVSGVRALHRKETLHQDLKLDNIVVDRSGCVKVIDFGSCKIGGLAGTQGDVEGAATLDFAAPEYRLDGTEVGVKSDQFSIAMIAYHLLSGGKGPYGGKWGKARDLRDFRSLEYIPVLRYHAMVPVWMDGALERALKVSAEARYSTLSELVNDLKEPNMDYVNKKYLPIMERDPVLFWKVVSAVLALALVLVLSFK